MTRCQCTPTSICDACAAALMSALIGEQNSLQEQTTLLTRDEHIAMVQAVNGWLDSVATQEAHV